MQVGDIVRCNNGRRWGDALSLVLEIYADVWGISKGAALLLLAVCLQPAGKNPF